MPPRPPIYRARGVRTPKQHKAAHDAKRLSAHERGYDRQWRKVRALKLSMNPLCERCAAAGLDSWATHVDHVIPLEQRPDLRLVIENLESQCGYHHNVVKQREESAWRGSTRPDWLTPSRIPLEIVCGPVASGKSTWAAQHMGPRDLLIDLDVIGSRLSGLPFTHDWDRRHLDAALRERNATLGALSSADIGSRWARAWFVVSEASPGGRAWWQEHLEPRRITVMETPPELCLQRVKLDPDRSPRLEAASHAIGLWWQTYEPREGEHVVRPPTY